MKLTAHLGKITWSLADKVLYVAFGLVQFVQIAALPAEVYGVFTLLVALNTWIMIVSDGSALAGIIQYGVHPEERKRVNLMALIIHTIVVRIASSVLFAFASADVLPQDHLPRDADERSFCGGCNLVWCTNNSYVLGYI